MADRTCGEQIPFLLAELGVDTVFGIPGVHSLELYRTLESAGLKHVSARHEQGAGFMADGYARASRRAGVALLISGPGVTNASTPLGQAYSDSVPLMLVSAAVSRTDLGMDRGALHEIRDQRALTSPITGASSMAYTASQVPQYLIAAFARFHVARPRPAHLSVPLDVLSEPASPAMPVPALPSPPGPDPARVRQLAEMLGQARTPLILAGGGAVAAARDITLLVERTGALFVSTIAGKGIVPDSHPQSLGSTMQRPQTRRAIAEADLVVAIGTEIAEPDLYVTADAEASNSIPSDILDSRLTIRGRFARIDIDPDVLVRDYAPDAAMVSDAALAVRALMEVLDSTTASDHAGARAASIRQANMAALSPLETVHQRVLLALRSALPPDALVYADMTQIAYTGCVTFPTELPGCWHFPMGYGTLGYALPAAIGGQLACPARAVACLIGDGGLQFTLQEIATAVELKLPIAIVLWDNAALGEIADFMRARQIPQIGIRPFNPDFAALARAYGASYVAPESEQQISEAVRKTLTNGAPALIHVRQDRFGA